MLPFDIYCILIHYTIHIMFYALSKIIQRHKTEKYYTKVCFNENFPFDVFRDVHYKQRMSIHINYL